MKNEVYKNCWVLIDYCLGLLTEEEQNIVVELCKEYPEIDAELKQLQNGLEHYVVKKTTWKKEELKKRIWDTIDKINKNCTDC